LIIAIRHNQDNLPFIKKIPEVAIAAFFLLKEDNLNINL
jgi:hypothetical protein